MQTQNVAALQTKLEDCTMSYFRLPGLAEPIRMALAVSGVKFNEDTLDFPAFKKKKERGDFSFGQVPVLDLADGRCMCACKTKYSENAV